MAKIKFDWDAGNLGKCAARVPIAEIEALFNGGVMRVRRDPCPREERYQGVGKNALGRGIFVAFTYRWKENELHVRPVSVRCIHREKGRKE